MTDLVARRARLPPTFGGLYSSSGTTEERRRQPPWGSGLRHQPEPRTYPRGRFFVALFRNARRISDCKLSEIPSLDASIAVAAGVRPSLAAI